MNARIWAVAAASAAAAATVTAVATSGGAAAAPPAQTIHVQETATHETYVPVGHLTGSKAQSNQGDYVVFDDPLMNSGSTTHVGRIRGNCWVVNPKAQLYFCVVETTFNGKGEIDASGLFDGTGKTATTASISGGSGTYQNATGTVQVKALSQNKNDFVFTLG